MFSKRYNKNYKEFNNIVKPDGLNLDYELIPIGLKKIYLM
jgi:hypothetical protein